MISTGIVTSLNGVVKAVATDGTERQLRVGDRVFIDEQVVTGDSGTISIEFSDGLVMDLGRNAQSILDEDILNLDFDIVPKEDVIKAEVQATQEALLKDQKFDPTVDLEAPAAGVPAAVPGAGDDDGFDVVKVDYEEPRMTPVSGFETTGIGVKFTEIIPELILEPQRIQGGGLIGNLGNASEGALPSAINCSLFTLNEAFVEGAPELTEGDSSKWLGFRIAPSEQDTINSITIKGFPENTNLSESDWLIAPSARVVDQDANYQVNFVSGPTQSPDNTWEVSVEVTGALPGEEVSFILSVIPMENIDSEVSLEVETTVDNSSGGFTESAEKTIAINFAEDEPVTPPETSIFTLNEQFEEQGPELTDSDSSKWLGFRITPSGQDAVTSVTIKGFPENSDLSKSDWFISSNARVVDQDANYQVNFVNGPTQSADDTWEVSVEVVGALSGEEVSFVLSVIPKENVDPEVSLEIETTVNNSVGEFTSTSEETVAITFDDLLDGGSAVFSSSGSGIFSGIGSAEASLLIHSMNTAVVQQENIETSTVDVL